MIFAILYVIILKNTITINKGGDMDFSSGLNCEINRATKARRKTKLPDLFLVRLFNLKFICFKKNTKKALMPLKSAEKLRQKLIGND